MKSSSHGLKLGWICGLILKAYEEKNITKELHERLLILVSVLEDAARTARVLRTIGESYRNFSVVALREAELRAELARVPDVVARVPTFEDDIGDVEGLAAIARHLYPVPAP